MPQRRLTNPVQVCGKPLVNLLVIEPPSRLGVNLGGAGLKGCDRAGARDYAAFLGFFFLEPS